MTEPLRVLGIFPHPDDESYSSGGTLARLAAEGAGVHVLCATAGSAGMDLRANVAPVNDLGATRAAELACACDALCLPPPAFLGLPDGRVGDVNFSDVAGEIIREIRSVRPQVVITLGADGVYGHPDHLALYRLVVAAFGAAGGGDRFPESDFGLGWAPQRLYLAAFPRGMFRPMFDHMLESEYATTIRGLDPGKLGVEPQDVAAAIDIREFSDRKLAAIACHRSQLRDGDPNTLFPNGLVQRTLTTELFTLGAGKPVSRRLRNLSEDLEL